MYTHEIKSSGQKCFRAASFPVLSDSYKNREKQYPMMMLESGQVTRVRADNLKKIEK